MIIENIQTIRAEIQRVAESCGRKAQDIRLMLVTKTIAANEIRTALASGETLIGENKVQELHSKYDALADIAHETHMIGHLQSNKVKDVIGYASCIQSLDRLKLAQRLQARLEFSDQTISALLQVNTSSEASKSGVDPEQALALIHDIRQFERIKLTGLMTIGSNHADEAEVRRCFSLLKQLQIQAQQKYGDYSDFSVLSMGMSADMRIAIEEGSTLLRLGSAIFGARQYSV